MKQPKVGELRVKATVYRLVKSYSVEFLLESKYWEWVADFFQKSDALLFIKAKNLKRIGEGK